MKTITRKRIKKLTAVVMTLVFLLQGMSMLGFAEEGVIDSAPVINFQKAITSQNSVNKGGRLLAQVSQFLPSWYNANWDQATKTMTIQYDDTVVVVKVGSKTITKTKNGNVEIITSDQPAQVINGRTLLPLKDTAKALELNLSYDNNTKTAIVQKSSDGSINTIDQTVINSDNNGNNTNNSATPLDGGISTQEIPQGVITNAKDLKIINSGKIKKVIVDGKEVEFTIQPSKSDGKNTLYLSIPSLRQALTTWKTVGVLDYEGKLVFNSDATFPIQEGQILKYDLGTAVFIWRHNGKVIFWGHVCGNIDPIPEDKVKATDWIILFKVDAIVQDNILFIETKNRGNINKYSSPNQVAEYLFSPDLATKYLGPPREVPPLLK